MRERKRWLRPAQLTGRASKARYSRMAPDPRGEVCEAEDFLRQSLCFTFAGHFRMASDHPSPPRIPFH